jgi:aspartokinase
VTTTDYEAVPAVGRDDAARHVATVVMKFGGSSVADPEKLKNVARRLVASRENGSRVVAVLSAMGKTTDDLLDLAHQIAERPEPRELDMLISVGERISCALAAMAIQDLGHEAISLTGSRPGSSLTRSTARRRSSTFAHGGSTKRSTRAGSSSSPASRECRQIPGM